MDEREWTTHEGGSLPYSMVGKVVDVKHRDGSISHNREVPSLNHWRHLGTSCDIVAYRAAIGQQMKEQT